MPAPKPRTDDDRLPSRFQDSLLTALCLVDDDNTANLAERIDPELFDQPYDDIVARCLEYRKQFKRPPGAAHIDDVVAHILDHPNHKQYKAYGRIVVGMLDQKDTLDTAFVLDKYNEFAKARMIRQGISGAVEQYQKGNYDEAVRVATDAFNRAPDAGQPRLEAVPLRKIRMRPVLWDWSLYIPAYKPVAIVGPPDTGKSLLVCDFATTMAGGFDWPDGSSAGEPGNVLIMTTEDTAADVLKPRLMAAGAAKIMDRIDVLRMKDKLFSLKTDLPWLEAQLERRKYRAVFIEPFYAFVGDRVDTYRDGEMQRLLAPVTELADRYGTTMFANIHFNKNAEALAIDRVSGARGTGGTFRAIYAVVADPEDDECSLFLKVKNNLAPRSLPGWKFRIKEHRINDAITAPYVKWIGKDERNIDAILTGNKKKESKKLDAAADFLLDTLRDGRTLASKVEKEAEAAGLKWRTIQEAAERMGVRRRRDKFRGPYYWRLPTE